MSAVSLGQTKTVKTPKNISLLLQKHRKPEEHTTIQKKILEELQALQDAETLDPTKGKESRRKFLGNFDWKVLHPNPDAIARIEHLFVNSMTFSPDTDLTSA